MAMFAMLLPQTLWACPMTGRIGDAAMVCGPASAVGKAPQSSNPLPMQCAHMGGKCCKPVTVPPQQGDDKGHPVVSLSADFSHSHPHIASFASIDYPVVFGTHTLQVSPAFQSWLALFANSPPPRKAERSHSFASGRAPPVL
jgi:hypothetical protein